MSTWMFRITMALLLIAIVLVADATDKRVHRANQSTVIHPCALVLTQSGQSCR